MRRTETASSPRPLAAFRLTRRVSVQWLATAIGVFFAAAYCFGYVRAAIRGEPLEPIVIGGAPPPALWLVSFVLVALVVVCHELLHGLFMARYGDAPEYGIGVSHVVLPYAYAGTKGVSFTRSQLLVTLLAPFVGITVAGLAALAVFPAAVLIVPLAANAAGSIGDLWMAATLLRYPPNARVTELEDAGVRGFAIYADGAAASAASGSESASRSYASDSVADRRTGATLLVTFLSGAVGTLAVLVGVAIAAVLASLAFGTGSVAIGDPTGRWILIRHVLGANGTASLEIGAAPILAAMGAGGLAWTVASAVRGTRP